MTNQILHINSDNVYISKNRGKIICEYKNDSIKKEMPIEDLIGIVIASSGMSITSNIVSSLLENNAFILHCDKKYCPTGITVSTEQVIRKDALTNQAQINSTLHKQISHEIIKQKVLNQAAVLHQIKKENQYILNQAKKKKISESACARYYWQNFFDACGVVNTTRNTMDDSDINAMLNYGYAVLRALCHRSVVAHGLSPIFGVNHKMRYQAHAFVYDVMEPLRPFVDLSLYHFLHSCDIDDITEQDFKKWVKFSQGMWEYITLQKQAGKYKLINAVEQYTVSVVDAFEGKNAQKVWIPNLNNIDIKKDPSIWGG